VSHTDQPRDMKGSIAVFFLKLLGLLPITLAGKIGRGVGHLAWWLAPGPRKVTLKNLALCFPDLSDSERVALAKESIIETIQTAFEFGPAWSQPPDRLLNQVTHADNEQILLQAQKQGKGVVFIVPHFGNWELANYYMSRKCSLLAMYKPAESPALNRLIYQSRSKNTEMVPADRRGVLALYKALPKGKATGVLPDQEPEIKTGVWVPFFGIPALTPKLVSKLANDTDSVAIGFGCQRNKDGKGFHVFYEPVDADFYDKDIETSAAAMNRCVERIIMRDPSQYQWEYKRFKRRPDSYGNFYK
jgi:KDO2-lipid IV(A) lauroyltransferase